MDHLQALEPHGDPGASWQTGIEGRKQVLIDGSHSSPAMPSAFVVTGNPGRLLGSVRQFDIPVRELQRAEKHLEPIRDVRAVRAEARKSRLARRVVP